MSASEEPSATHRVTVRGCVASVEVLADIDGQVADLALVVAHLLNTLDMPIRVVSHHKCMPSVGSPLKLFYSCAAEDHEFRSELEKHLSMLEREGMIVGWHSRLVL